MFRRALEALRKGVRRSAQALGGGVRALLLGRDLDEALIDRLETSLVSADVGVVVARELVEEVRREFRSGRVTKGGEAIEILKARLKDRLRGGDWRWPGRPRAPPWCWWWA